MGATTSIFMSLLSKQSMPEPHGLSFEWEWYCLCFALIFSDLPTGSVGQESIILIPVTRYGYSAPSCSIQITLSDYRLRQIRDA